MSFEGRDSGESLVSVAKALRTRGLKGELVAEILTDFPERFEAIQSFIALAPNGERKVVELENFWFQNGRIILKLSGCDSVEAASEFTGYEFCVSEADRVPLADDEYYDSDLEGCSVELESGQTIGTVQSVLKTGGTEILVVGKIDKSEVLIPLAESIVIEIDTTGKRIVVDPPEGLLELS